ncbi:hypothetical protein Q0M94_20400 (plasmid) [Deinococcus radiomollis]|uniref:hypothetical protein n=1 Tax=Deinococcus radiomollis TaxID=468916 RepID=UPI0038929BF9
MIKAAHLCAATLLTLSLAACSRTSSTSAPSQDTATQSQDAATQAAQVTDSGASAVPNLLGGTQATGRNSGRADPEASPWNKIRPQGITPITSVIFNVVAHADDWELFMNPNVYNQMLQENTKSVFIYTTAGDGGAGNGPTPQQPYFVAREDGANRAVRFIANVTPAFSSNTVVSKVKFRGHTIRKVVYKNTVSYFLRLNDGAPDGQGYTTNAQTLQHLYEGQVKQMTAVDNSATYVGWSDLANTVASIISAESRPFGVASFNLMDPDPMINPDDHSDHLHTSLLVQDSLKDKTCVSVSYFQTYDTSWQDVNVPTDDLVNQAALFGVMESGKGDSGYPGSWESFHKTWLGKNYFRTVPATTTAPCL